MQNIRRMGYLLVLVIGAALLTAMMWRPAPPTKFVGLTTAQVPRSVGGYWAPNDYEMPDSVKQALASADVISRTYGQGQSKIDFVLLGGTSREALHDPRSCLAGAGWVLANDHTERLPGTQIDVHACKAIGLPGAPGFDVLYLYVVDGRRASSIGEIRRHMLVTALLGRQNEPVYMLRFMEPLTTDVQTQAANHAQMMDFAAQMWKTLQPKIATT